MGGEVGKVVRVGPHMPDYVRRVEVRKLQCNKKWWYDELAVEAVPDTDSMDIASFNPIEPVDELAVVDFDLADSMGVQESLLSRGLTSVSSYGIGSNTSATCPRSTVV